MNLKKFTKNGQSSFVCTTGVNNKHEKVKTRLFVVTADTPLEAKFNLAALLNGVCNCSVEVYKRVVANHAEQAAVLLKHSNQ